MKKFLFICFFLGIGFWVWFYTKNNGFELTLPQQVACTEEAKQCPDGSFVGRTGPKCEFAACPDGVPSLDFLNSASGHSGEQLVYFRSVKRDGFSALVEVDSIEMFSGEEARQAALKDTGCTSQNVVTCAPSLNNSFYIRNTSSSTKTLRVDLSTDIYLISDTDAPNLQKVGLLDLKEKYDAGLFSNFVDQPFWIQVTDGKIKKIEQQYIP